MDMVTVVSWVLAAAELVCTFVVGGIAFFLKRELNRVSRLEERQHKFELKVTNGYVTKEEFYRNNGEVIKRLDKIQDLIMKIMSGTAVKGD